MAFCSIVISTFNRLEHLLLLLDTYGHGDLPNLDAIHIAWVRFFPPSLSTALNC